MNELVAWVGSSTAPGGSVLDVGCATGEIAGRLADLGYEVVGLDLSPAMIRRARRRSKAPHSRLTFEVADVARPREPGVGRFDSLLLFGLLQCVPRPRSVLRASASALRSGGSVLMEVKRPRLADPAPGVDAPGRGWMGRIKEQGDRSAWVHPLRESSLIRMCQSLGLGEITSRSTDRWIRVQARRT